MDDEMLPTAHGSLFSRLGNGITSLLVKAGLTVTKALVKILLGTFSVAKLILSELSELLGMIFKAFLWLLRELTDSLRGRSKKNRELQREVRHAAKLGEKEHRIAVIRFAGSYLFGEGGVFYTAFNYALPIISAAFLIGVIRYGASLEYGISVSYNGKEIGVVSSEADFNEAEREVQQRISYASPSDKVDIPAQFSLKIISENDTVLTASQLANTMLEASDEELMQAYGIYIDGKFIGAVKNMKPVSDALDEHLLNYHVEGNVKDISYQNKIEYSDGIFLADSVMDEQAAIDQLTSSTEKNGVYVAKAGDSAVIICEKYNMELSDLQKLNPGMKDDIKAGQLINVTETESYLPIKYVREMEMLSFLDYETIEVETSALNVGTRGLLVKGERGEKMSQVEISYIDGIEYSRRVVSSEITKNPVVEQIGIGTYSARPSSASTVLTGNGLFGWPVDGGYISDPFMSDRNHKGMDIAAPQGTAIYAAGDGVVLSAGWNSGGYGNVVMIGHEDGYQTVYGHMVDVVAIEGQTVTRGQLIGYVGTTGDSTGNHCHFEVRCNGVCLDPADFLNTVDAFKDDEENEDTDEN